jgi:two-component system, chemotaxis family, chemotaxis protein CheY
VLVKRPILIVDDDEETREALSEFLQINGYYVENAENGEAALDEIAEQQNKPGLILLDLMMPVMDGDTFIRRARDDSEIKNVPIILITAHPSGGAHGANAVLGKPVKPERLLSLMAHFLQPTAG